MFAGSSNETPAGGTPNDVMRGDFEWQATQRAWTTAWTSANVGPAACAPPATLRPAGGVEARGAETGAVRIATPARAPATGASTHQRDGPLPIIACRTPPPASIRSPRTSQFR